MCSMRSCVRAVHPVSKRRRRPAELPAADPAADDQLSRKVQRNLSLRDDDDPPSDQPQKTADTDHQEARSRQVEQEEPDATTSQEVGELAGYFGELYLPRASVSADAALMVELMYT